MNSCRRTEYLRHFSLSNWNGLPESQKSEHTMSQCHACQVHHFAVQSLFPNAIKFKPQKLVSKTKPTQRAIKTAAKHIYSKVNGHFQKIFEISFAEAQTKVSKLELQQKKAKFKRSANVDSEHAKRSTRCKRNGPNEMLIRCWEQGSLTVSGKNKGALCTLRPQMKQLRVAKRKRQEDLGVRKKKRHSPQPNQLDFDKENLLKGVQNMKEGDKVRFNLLILVTVKFLT